MSAVPGALATSNPLAGHTLATAGSLLLQTTGRPTTGVPPLSVTSAHSESDSPTTSRSTPLTRTVATGGSPTVISAMADSPPLRAKTSAVPVWRPTT